MLRKYLIPLIAVLYLMIPATSAFAVPNGNIEIITWPVFFQDDLPWGEETFACKESEKNDPLKCPHPEKKIKDKGCATTSMTMLLRYYGLRKLPDPDYYPIYDQWLRPGVFDDWLVDNHGYDNGDLHFLNTVSRFYYKNYPYYNFYYYLAPNYDCSPYSPERRFDCFIADWGNKAEKLLDDDLEWGIPAIMKIRWKKETEATWTHKSHFVMIGGYDPENASYRDYDPNSKKYPGNHIPPRGFNYSYGAGNYEKLRINRFIGFINRYPANLARLDLGVHSPVEIQLIDPSGKITGYDPISVTKLQENPMSLYYEEEPISSINGSDEPAEPVKLLSVAEPLGGNYILKIVGTGNGPYSINIHGTKEDGTPNLETSLTGNAYPGLTETYRIQYFPTGEATISSENQASVADAGPDQTVEQSYDVTLRAENSHDSDGDPLKYSWSFVSKPEGSSVSLSNASSSNPSFTPDKPGTYTLQLIVNDGFIDSATDTVTITATPIQSYIAVTPNFSTPLTSGNTAISFDINNTGRIGVSSGLINISLRDADGVTIFNGSRVFSLAVGESKSVDVPVTIPSLKFGNYALTYTQSDETKTGTTTTVTIPNTVLATFSFDKLTYRAREQANMTLNLMDTGKFDLGNITVTVSVPDSGYVGTGTALLTKAINSQILFTFIIPDTITPGQHYVNATLTLPSGSSVVQSGRFAVQESALVIGYSGQTTLNGGDTINLTIENTGSVDTSYLTEKLVLKSNRGEIIYEGSIEGTVMVGEKKTLADITIPAQTASGIVFLNAVLKDSKTGKLSYLSKSLNISGLETSLLAITDKEAYLNTEAITAVTTLATASFPIEEGELDVKVSRYSKPSGGEFTTFIPKNWLPVRGPSGVAVDNDGYIYLADNTACRVLKLDAIGKVVAKWGSRGSGDGQFLNPNGIAVGPDGSVYVADSGNHRIQKFDGNGNLIAKWGSGGIGDGELNSPIGITVAMNGFVYVTELGNHRIHKFDGNGGFIAKWGSYGSGNGQFNQPWGVAVTPDSFVYVADTWNNRIQKFDSHGNFISQWGSAGSGNSQFYKPYGIAIATDGSAFVTDKDNYRIQKFGSNGGFITKWGGYGNNNGKFQYPIGIATSLNGSIYVADAWNDGIQKFDGNGNFIDSWRNYCNNDLNYDRVPDQQCNGEFGGPNGTAIGPDGSLYVMEGTTWNTRIQKFDGNGNFLTKWGTYGTGNGQFIYPKGIAIGAEGFLYVADTHNHRIQKFDSNGNFIAKWGSYGSAEGQFSYPQDVAVVPDGSVYVADSGNNRVQKFDRNGNFIASWWAYGISGQSIAVAPDGSVYVNYAKSYWRDDYCVRIYNSNGDVISPCWGDSISVVGSFEVAPDGSVITIGSYGSIQKLDSNGNLITTLGGGKYGDGDGQFKGPSSIAVGTDGSIYVADTDNNRIQKMSVFSLGGSETVFETTLPVTQPSGMSQEYVTNVGNLNVTGKLYLHATLKNKMGQVIASAEYPFYIANSNTVLLFKTDKKIYKLGETITVTGEVRNLADAEATNLKSEIKSRRSDGITQVLYTEAFNIPAGGEHLFTFTAIAGSEGVVALLGTLSQNNSTLAEVTDQYEVARPAVAVTLSGPDIVGKNPFDLYIEVKNTGKIDFNGQLSVVGGWWNTIDNQQLTIPVGETRLLQYKQQITQTTNYAVSISGDINQTITKTAIFGEAAAIQFGVNPSPQPSPTKGGGGFSGSGLGVYPEGRIEIPVTITNTGLVDEALTVNFSLQPLALTESRNYFLPRGGSITDTLYYNLTEGSYQISAVSSQPYVFTQTSFTVLKDNDVTMTNTVGSQGADGFIPLTVNLTNNGFNEINGSIQLTVLNNQGKAVWRGETLVSSLKSRSSMTYPINVNSSGIIPGAYKTDIVLYSTSGQQLATNQTQVRVSGPIFEITAMPNYPTFTAGKQGSFAFTIKNTGTAAGTTSLSVKAMDVLNQSVTDTFNLGEEKTFTFSFTVPEDAEEKDYNAEYTLTPTLSQGERGKVNFRVAGVNIKVDASLDKTAYRNGDTAVLTLTVSKFSQFEDGNYIAIIRYGAQHDMKAFTLSNQPATLTFSVPLTVITGENLFYSIHFTSGRTIYSNAVSINKAQPDLFIEDLSASQGSLTTYKLSVVIANQGKIASEATAVNLYDGDPSTGASLIATMTIPGFNQNESATILYDWNVLGKAGNHTIYAVVDPNNTVTEWIEANNTRSMDITLPNLILGVSTTEPSYKANQDVGMVFNMANLTPSITYQGLKLDTTIIGTQGVSVFNAVNDAPTLSPATEASYAFNWNTRSNAPGDYTVNARLLEAANTLTEGSTLFTILPTPSLIGSMSLSKDTVIQGFGLDINYALTNNGNIDLSGGEANVEFIPVGSEIPLISYTQAFGSIAILADITQTLDIQKIEVEPGDYTVRLTAVAEGVIFIIGEKPLKVLPPLEVTKQVSMLPRVLVLLGEKEDEDEDKDEGSKGKGQGTYLNEVIITNALNSMGAYYRIITDKKRFKQEMRSGIYTAYILAGKKPLEDHVDEELVERVNSGDRLILLNYEKIEDEKFREVVGAKSEGHLSDKQRTLAIIENPMTPQGAFSISGKVEKLEKISPDAIIAGTIQEKGKTYPGILINHYGKGKVVTFAFDMAKSAKDSGDTASHSLLLRDAIAYGAPDEIEPIPGTPLGVEITLKSLGQAFGLKVEEKLSAELPVLLTWGQISNLSPDGQTITWEFKLQANDTESLLYLIKLPEDRGTYTPTTEVFYLRNGSYEPYNTYPLTTVAEGLHDIQMRILSGLEAINEGKVQEISEDYQELLNNIVPNMEKKDIEEVIHDLMEIIEELGELKADTKDIRFDLDRLMRALERRWVEAGGSKHVHHE